MLCMLSLLVVLMEIVSADGDWKLQAIHVESLVVTSCQSTSNPESKLHLNGGTSGVFPLNIEASGAKYLLFTKGPQTNPNNKLGWIGYAGDNKKMVFRNAKGSEMIFETQNIFNFSVK